MKKTRQHPNILVFVPLVIISGCAFINSGKIAPPLQPRYANLEIAPLPETDGKTLKIVSFNIAFCAKIERAKILLLKNKDLADADILCLQEMCPEGVEYLAEALRGNYVYYPSAIHPRTRKEFGTAIISRLPMEQDYCVDLPLTDKDRFIKLPRNAAAASVIFNSRKILVFSVHLGVMITPEERQEQIQAIIDSIPSSADGCVIAGDFNTYTKKHTTAAAHTLAEAEFEDATQKSGWTFKYWYLLNKKEILDHIFIRGMEIKTSGRVLDRSASDHLPVWAECE